MGTKQPLLTSLVGMYLVVATILTLAIGFAMVTGHMSVQNLPVAFAAVASVIALLAMARSYRRNANVADLTRDDTSRNVNRTLAGLKPIIHAGLIIMPISLFAGLWMMRNESPILLLLALANLAITWWLVGLLKRAKCATN